MIESRNARQGAGVSAQRQDQRKAEGSLQFEQGPIRAVLVDITEHAKQNGYKPPDSDRKSLRVSLQVDAGTGPYKKEFRSLSGPLMELGLSDLPACAAF